jgi:Holliday junction resolvasome RuvABC DNA-binding subunit
MKVHKCVFSVIALACFCSAGGAQSLSQQRQAKVDESARPKNVSGGTNFQVQLPYDTAYDEVLNWIKRANYTIDSADKTTGQVITAMTITGSVSQTGTRLILTLIKDGDSATTIKVAVTEQNRKKILQTEPWSDPKVNDKESQRIADQIKTALPSAPLSVASLSIGSSAPTGKKSITDNDVIRLVKNGFTDEQILAVIGASEPKFDISVDALIDLKSAGVSQKLIETILLSGKSPQPTTVSRTTTESPAATANPALPAQPYALLLSGDQKTLLASHLPTMLQTNAKGDSMATILADDTVHSIASNAVTSVASSAAMSAGMAAMPIIGVAGNVITKLPGLRRDPTITIIYALAGRQSPTALPADHPKFEIFYGDVVGANPDDFVPSLVKISPTNNNWRLTGAEKTNPKYLQSHQRTDFTFIEEVIPIRTTNLGRGHIAIELQDALPPGEYGIVLRPVSKTWKVDVSDLAAKSGEGVLLLPVWDFSIGAKAENK